MTSPRPTQTDQAVRDRVWRPLLHLLGVVLPTAAVTALTLSAGSPAVPGLDSGPGTIHYDWWLFGFLLVVPVFISAHACPRLAIVTVLLASIPQFIILHILIARTEAGIKTFADLIAAPVTATAAYTQAVAMALLFAASGMWGAGTPRRDRLPRSRFFV